MKRLLCVLLITACVLTLGSCELLEKFISFERFETDAPTDPAPTTPDASESENKKPTDDNADSTTPEKDNEQTEPEKDPSKDENNDGIPDGEQDTNKPEGNDPNAPTPKTITVTVEWQSGGIPNHSATVTTTAPVTLSHVYRLFAEELFGDTLHSEVLNIDGIKINDQWVDASDVIYMNDGDYVKAVEWNAKISSHLHVWYIAGDGVECVRCHEKCSHGEWNNNVCFFCKYECWHNEWEWNVCATCPFVCLHENRDDSGQCYHCRMYIGEEFLNIEIYEDYEEKPFYHQTHATTLRGLIRSLYPQDWWIKIESEYDFYFNGTPIDSSSPITESGRLDMVKRSQP